MDDSAKTNSLIASQIVNGRPVHSDHSQVITEFSKIYARSFKNEGLELEFTSTDYLSVL